MRSKSQHLPRTPTPVLSPPVGLRRCLVSQPVPSPHQCTSQIMPDTQPTVEELSQVTLIKCILSFQEGDGAVIQSLKRRLQTTCNDLADVKSKLSSPDSAINNKLEFMQQHITNQVEIITKQQQFLESVESLAGVTSDEDKLKKIWSELGEELPPCTHQRL